MINFKTQLFFKIPMNSREPINANKRKKPPPWWKLRVERSQIILTKFSLAKFDLRNCWRLLCSGITGSDVCGVLMCFGCSVSICNSPSNCLSPALYHFALEGSEGVTLPSSWCGELTRGSGLALSRGTCGWKPGSWSFSCHFAAVGKLRIKPALGGEWNWAVRWRHWA